jgi:hypothetical protein
MVANPNPTPNKSSASSRTRQPNNQLLQKKRGGVHPDIVSHLRNTPPWIIPKSNDKKTYGTLTDESTYSEYAWEFLRRNRFYQALIDKTKPAFDENDWGYRREPEAFPVYGIYGLPPKRYDEAYAQGKPVEWYGIHDFVRDRLNIMSRPGGRNNTPLEHVRSQIEIIFDFGPVFGPGTPAIEIQIALAQEKLKELAGKFASEFPLCNERTRQKKRFLELNFELSICYLSQKHWSWPSKAELRRPLETPIRNPVILQLIHREANCSN